MGQLSALDTVGQLVAQQPSASRVLTKLGIDFCCGGRQLLAEACRERGLDVESVLAALESEAPNLAQQSWVDAPLSALVGHLVERHHSFTRTELGRLGPMLDKVARVHGDRYPYMREVAALFRGFAAELAQHMEKEEAVLFPAICALEAGRGVRLNTAIVVMRAEHELAGSELSRLRALTHGYEAPADVCNTFRAALAGLADLEDDLHLHVHLENNVLFERVLSGAR